MRHGLVRSAVVVACIIGASACVVTRPLHLKSSALEYLYPAGKETATPARDVTLEVPVRIGVAFAPKASSGADPFTELQKQRLLDRIAGSFRENELVKSIEPVPSTYLTPGGGFAELDRMAQAFGLDLMALVSYDQRQFTETGNSSWTYLTVIGAFMVRGEKNETRTLMDTVVYDIPSRALLFRAAGESASGGRSTPVEIDRALRQKSEAGFEEATDDMIANLGNALTVFKEQVKSGTIRGAGTPAIQVVDAKGAAGAGGGAGALGGAELLLAAGLAWLLIGAGRRRPS